MSKVAMVVCIQATGAVIYLYFHRQSFELEWGTKVAVSSVTPAFLYPPRAERVSWRNSDKKPAALVKF